MLGKHPDDNLNWLYLAESRFKSISSVADGISGTLTFEYSVPDYRGSNTSIDRRLSY